MTKLEIIKEVLEDRYCKNPSLRAIECDNKGNAKNCLYELRKDDGTVLNCAVGTCLTKKGIAFAMKNNLGGVWDFGLEIDSDDFVNVLEENLKERYKGHSIDFWSDLQGFHDNDEYFTETGISILGQGQLNRLKEIYA